ncbi:MAG TPA: hypothetical protein VFJ02_25605 [Vicinamibacterales bacterium]|nr:hypothetical protein [Vicinamibacterales bacterium]
MRAVYFERIAWVLLAALIAFWTWFGLASALAEKLGWQNFVLHLLLPGGAFAAIAAIAWRSRVIGGVLLIAAGALIALLYPFAGGRFPGSTVVLLLSTLAAPPIAAGVLMLESTRSTQH